MRSKKTKPTVMMFCGLPGSGKTTLARQLAAERQAVRLCPDEWMADLKMDFYDEAFRSRLEVALWKQGQELLKLGQDVIVENGLWSRKERDEKRRDASRLDVRIEIHYMATPLEEIHRRIEARNKTGGHGTVPVTHEQLDEYAKMFQPPDAAELALFDTAFTHKPKS